MGLGSWIYHLYAEVVFDFVKQSGLLPSACQKWRLMTPANINCKTHFLQYVNDLANEATPKQQGFHAEEKESNDSMAQALLAATQHISLLTEKGQTKDQQIAEL